tara:strand:- start:1594 stop:2427 length:834 start_codon:yes stop_codon:yes gene_type:complete
MNENEHLETKKITANFLSDRLIKIKVSEIVDAWSDKTSDKNSLIRKIRKVWRKTTKARRLRMVKKSILKFGYNPEKFGYITVNNKYPNDERPYRAIDGNHRVMVLMELYGPDYEITVSDITSYFTKDNVGNKADTTLGRLKEGFSYIPLMYYPSIMFFTWYMFLEVMLFSLFCSLILTFMKDRSRERFTDEHPKEKIIWVYNKSKVLYEIIMNIYYNFRNIILGVAFLCYVYYILSTYFYGLLIIGGITIVIMFTFKFLGLSTILNLRDAIKKIKDI